MKLAAAQAPTAVLIPVSIALAGLLSLNITSSTLSNTEKTAVLNPLQASIIAPNPIGTSAIFCDAKFSNVSFIAIVIPPIIKI